MKMPSVEIRYVSRGRVDDRKNRKHGYEGARFQNGNISLVLKRDVPSGGYFQVTSEGARKQLYRESSSEISVASEPKMAPDAETLEIVD